MIEGVSQVIVEVEDQDRALKFWTEPMGFELALDAPYGEAGRWIEVRTRDKDTILVSLQQSWGWWSKFRNQEGNRFALHPREGKWISRPQGAEDR